MLYDLSCTLLAVDELGLLDLLLLDLLFLPGSVLYSDLSGTSELSLGLNLVAMPLAQAAATLSSVS